MEAIKTVKTEITLTNREKQPQGFCIGDVVWFSATEEGSRIVSFDTRTLSKVKVEVLETPEQIQEKMAQLGQLIFMSVGYYFTLYGANSAVAYYNDPDHGLPGPANYPLIKDNVDELIKFIKNPKINIPMQDQTILSLGGNPKLVREFVSVARDLIASYGTISRVGEGFIGKEAPTTCIEISCPSREKTDAYIVAIRTKLPLQGSMMAIVHK